MQNFEKPLLPEENIDEIDRILTDLESKGDFNDGELKEAETQINRLSRNVDPNELERRFGGRMKQIFDKKELDN